MTNQNQPSEVKEGGALENAVQHIRDLLAFSEQMITAWPDAEITVERRKNVDHLRTVLDALAARPPSMERGDQRRVLEDTLGDALPTVPSGDILRAARLVDDALYAAAPSPAPSALSCFECGGLDFTGPVCVACNPAPSAVEMAGTQSPYTQGLNDWLAFGENANGYDPCDPGYSLYELGKKDAKRRVTNGKSPVFEALMLAEDVLSRAPFSTQMWPNGMHPNTGIETIRAALSILALATASREKGTGE